MSPPINLYATPMKRIVLSIAAGDHISRLSDECLGIIFQLLNYGDRKSCSLVCRRWCLVEGESRMSLYIEAKASLISYLPALSSRFTSVTKLVLRCFWRRESINDEALKMISIDCCNLTTLKLRGCRNVTDVGMAALGMHAKRLIKFSCRTCMFGTKGINALLNQSSSIEELSVKEPRRAEKSSIVEMLYPGVAASSLKSICLKDIYDFEFLATQLITGSKNLRSLTLLRCLGGADWDNILTTIANEENSLSEVYLDKVKVGDAGITALSKCSKLEILRVTRILNCKNSSILSVVKQCKLLRKLHIDGWRTKRILGEEGLYTIRNHNAKLQVVKYQKEHNDTWWEWLNFLEL